MPVPKSTRQRTSDHVPGSMEQAAVQAYFERGSKQAVERNGWRTAALMSMGVAVIASSAFTVMALKNNIHVFQVAKADGGQLQVVASDSKFTAGEDTQMAWTSQWMGELTEVSPALWQRNISAVQGKVVGVAGDQVKSFLQRENNNPAALLAKQPAYIREYERRSVNKVGDMTYLVRFETISRPAPGVTVQRASYAATVTLVHIGHKTRDDVFRNPEGLAVSSFSVSEESVSPNR